MVQSILFFVLGVLCAAFVIALVAPALWRRAVRLTQRRIEASAPLTRSEIAAQKDFLRAQFAVSARRLEMAAKALQDKNAVQAVEAARLQEGLKVASAQYDESLARISELENRNSELQQGIERRDAQLADRAARISQNEKELDERKADNARLADLYEEASFSSSNRQIELVAREAELDRLKNDLLALRGRQKESDARGKETAKESRAAREALSLEKKKNIDLDRKLERLMATIATYEERLTRREKEYLELQRGTKKNGTASRQALNTNVLGQAPAGADSGRFGQLVARGRGEDLEIAISQLAADRDRIEAELLGREGDDRADENKLRAELLDLAAKTVALAAKMDGAGSPILVALNASDGGKGASLAARARAILNVADD